MNVFIDILVFFLCTQKKQVYDTSRLILNMVGGTEEQFSFQSAVLMLMKKQLKRKMNLLHITMIACKAAPWGYDTADELLYQNSQDG